MGPRSTIVDPLLQLYVRAAIVNTDCTIDITNQTENIFNEPFMSTIINNTSLSGPSINLISGHNMDISIA